MTTRLLMHHISCRVFCQNIHHSGDSASLQPRFGVLRLLAFPQTKITSEREEISDYRWNSGKCDGAADGDWENCVRSQGAYLEGDWGIIVLRTMFTVPCIIFNKCLCSSYYVAGNLLGRTCLSIMPKSDSHEYFFFMIWHQESLTFQTCSFSKTFGYPK